ncbi:MAG: hypothetical protein EBU84_16080 [Actinobacteria bacterium]|nr:hypothetical protein [Actinomycetota bacterium]
MQVVQPPPGMMVCFYNRWLVHSMPMDPAFVSLSGWSVHVTEIARLMNLIVMGINKNEIVQVDFTNTMHISTPKNRFSLALSGERNYTVFDIDIERSRILDGVTRVVVNRILLANMGAMKVPQTPPGGYTLATVVIGMAFLRISQTDVRSINFRIEDEERTWAEVNRCAGIPAQFDVVVEEKFLSIRKK